MDYIDGYEIACIQNKVHVVVNNDPKEQDRIIAKNVARLKELIEWTVHHQAGRVKLFLTSEYALCSTYRPRTVADWMNLALPIPNRFTDELGAIAKQFGVYICSQLMERDPNFEGMFFDTAFIIDPQGQIILKYRKHNGPNNLNVQYVGPGDVYDKYIEVYGEDSMFPVVDTPLGVLGCFICYDINFPEVARCLTLKGAEVLLHLSAGNVSHNRYWSELKVARAWENVAYLASAEIGPWTDSRWPEHFGMGNSMVVSYNGDIIGTSGSPGERVTTGEINLTALRRRRAQAVPHQLNPFVQLRASLYAEEYRRAQAWPINAFAERPMQDRTEALALGQKLAAGWVDRGILKKPR